MAEPFYIEKIGEHEGKTVTVRGWLYNKRSSGKIAFLQLRDGTGVVQAVATPEDAVSRYRLSPKASRPPWLGKLAI